MLRRGRSERGRSVHFVRFGPVMKPINVFPMVVMLIVVVALIAWFGGYFS